MPELISPSSHVHVSWLEAVTEPGYEPRWADDFDLETLRDPRAFVAYVSDSGRRHGKTIRAPPGGCP
jgi:hypothetical protein